MEQPEGQARYACAACQRLKKKCDRLLPECSLCLRHHRSCSYGQSTRNSGNGAMTTVSASASSAKVYQQAGNGFPAVYFVDSLLFSRSLGHLPDTNLPIDSELQSFVGNVSDIKTFASTFLNYVHPWLPFISRKLFSERFLNPLARPHAETELLIAAVKLVAISPGEGDPRSLVYHHMKATLHQAEINGLLKFRIFQALILVALYEIGHAIYPSAYLTLGYCARYGTALGVNKAISGTSGQTNNWSESEEERRSWWAVIVLDRRNTSDFINHTITNVYVSLWALKYCPSSLTRHLPCSCLNLGCADRASVVEEPSSSSFLPMDDKQWELGVNASCQANVLSSPPTEGMGRFGLTVQAAVLLGRVFRNMNDNTGGDDFRNDEARLLDNAISALTQVSLEEGRYRGIGVCSPTTICYSSRLLLNDIQRISTNSWRDTPESISSPPDFVAHIAAEMLRLVRAISAAGSCGTEEISPFCLDTMYRSAIFYASNHKQTGNQSDLDALEDIKTGFKDMNSRWRVAGIYLQLIEARDFTGIW